MPQDEENEKESVAEHHRIPKIDVTKGVSFKSLPKEKAKPKKPKMQNQLSQQSMCDDDEESQAQSRNRHPPTTSLQYDNDDDEGQCKSSNNRNTKVREKFCECVVLYHILLIKPNRTMHSKTMVQAKKHVSDEVKYGPEQILSRH